MVVSHVEQRLDISVNNSVSSSTTCTSLLKIKVVGGLSFPHTVYNGTYY
jgi:hypothetical protein